MAYQTGTATDPVDLLDKLRVFALANGWTVHNFGARPAGATAGQALQLSKGPVVGSFLSLSAVGNMSDPGPKIGTYGHDAYSAGGGTENQPNGGFKCYANACAGPYQAYHFFSDDGSTTPPYLYVVAETSAGVFRHFGLGKLVGLGVLNSGVFAYGSRWMHDVSSNYISDPDSPWHAVPFDSTSLGFNFALPGTSLRADSDSISPRWHSTEAHTFAQQMWGGIRGQPSNNISQTKAIVHGPVRDSASQMTGRTLLGKCELAVARQSNLASPVGYPPGIRWVMLDNHDPGDVLTIGTEDWKLFPVIRKNGSLGQPNSGLYGYAYRMN